MRFFGCSAGLLGWSGQAFEEKKFMAGAGHLEKEEKEEERKEKKRKGEKRKREGERGEGRRFLPKLCTIYSGFFFEPGPSACR